MAEGIKFIGGDVAALETYRKKSGDMAAFIELHIEQGPVLESMNLPLGVVLGTFGVERHAIRFVGQSAHAGSTPMDQRRDALGAAAKLSLEIREIAKRNGGVCTVGSVVTKPGIVTAVVGQCDITLDQRHLNAAGLARMLQEAKDASERFAAEEKVSVAWQRIWQIHPILFNPELIELADAAIGETCGVVHRLPSGPLHDAAEVARAGVPTVMLFVQSLRGLSHTKEEDTKEEHLVLAVQADRKRVETIEGLTQSGAARRLQAAFVRRNALQCGFCTPGMLAAALELVETKPNATRTEVREWISGNYCRCTGYQAIVDAICDVLVENAEVVK